MTAPKIVTLESRDSDFEIWEGTGSQQTKVKYMTWAAAAFFFVCFWYGWTRFNYTGDHYVKTKFALWSIWTVGTPVYCLYEFCCMYRGESQCKFEVYKHAQELATKIWLAVATVLGVLFSGKAVAAELAKMTGHGG